MDNEKTTAMSVMSGGGQVAMQAANPIVSALDAADRLGEWMAKSQMYGVKTVEQGKVLAMTCVVEKITPMEFSQTYHVIDGKPWMRADAMVARLCRNGGDYEIIIWTDKVCKILFSWTRNGKPKTFEYEFTMDDANRAKLVKSGSAWEKTPKQMLFARCVSMGLRSFVPELFAGCCLPDESREDVVVPVSEESKPLIMDTPKAEPKRDGVVNPKYNKAMIVTEIGTSESPKTIEAEVVSESASAEEPATPETDAPPADEEPKLTDVLRKHKIKVENAVGLLLRTGWVTQEDIKGVPAGAILNGLNQKQKEKIIASIEGFKKRCEEFTSEPKAAE
jgi:hypothetical protein